MPRAAARAVSSAAVRRAAVRRAAVLGATATATAAVASSACTEPPSFHRSSVRTPHSVRRSAPPKSSRRPAPACEHPENRRDTRRNHPATSAPQDRPMDEQPTLVVVAHGSRDPRALRTIRALLRRVAEQRPSITVRLGHIEIEQPSLADTLASLGDGRAVLVPLLLGPGHHVTYDLPRLAAAAPRLRTTIAAPLGPHPLLVETLYARLVEAGWRDEPHRAYESGVVLAAAGSRDARSAAATRRTAALLGARLGESRSSPRTRRPPRPPSPTPYGSWPRAAGAVSRSRRTSPRPATSPPARPPTRRGSPPPRSATIRTWRGSSCSVTTSVTRRRRHTRPPSRLPSVHGRLH